MRSDQLTIDEGVVKIVDGAQIEQQITSNPLHRERYRATEPTGSIQQVALALPSARQGHGRPGGVGEIRHGP